MSAGSSQKLYVAFVAFDEVEIRTLGGVFGSQSEEYDANGSESMSADASGVMGPPSTGAVLGSLEPSVG